MNGDQQRKDGGEVCGRVPPSSLPFAVVTSLVAAAVQRRGGPATPVGETETETETERRRRLRNAKLREKERRRGVLTFD